MTINERRPPEDGLPGDFFIEVLEHSWGGKLHLSIADQHHGKLTDVTQYAGRALQTVYEHSLTINPHLAPPAFLASRPGEFKRLVVESSPHPDQASDRIHLLADPFCRTVLLERLETFLAEAGQIHREEEDPFIVVDELPFSRLYPGSVIFEDTPQFTNLSEYFTQAARRAYHYAQRLDLRDREKELFEREFRQAINRLERYTNLTASDQDENLHPIIRIITNATLFHFFSQQSSETPLNP